MRSVDAAIAELLEAYQSHRLADLEFDEICRDFETLSADLKNAFRHQGGTNVPDDLRESLAGLEQEIRAKIAGLEQF